MKDQIVLITGASRGIGRAIALRLAREGPAHIVVGYCSDYQSALRTTSDLAALGVEASAARVDVGQEDLVQQLFDGVRERFGRLDVFVSNAARTALRPAVELSAHAWQRIMDINARAFLLGARHAAALMRPNGGGRIVAISSLGSRFSVPGYAALGAAKATIEALARYLAAELAPWGINVNVVCGGFIDTDTMRHLPDYEALTKQIAAHTPAGRLGRPEDLAGVVALLCSPDADWIRGQTLVADGGYSLVL
jgi:enoyl-[acyl-carrier protein] reductase III